jgi:hypothetical protein
MTTRVGSRRSSSPIDAAQPRRCTSTTRKTFYVVDGEISVFVGDKRLEASADDFVIAPRGVPHSYLVRSERSRVLCTFSRAGLEQFFAEMGIAVVDGEPEPTPVVPDPDTFTSRLAAYCVEVVAPPPELSQHRLTPEFVATARLMSRSFVWRPSQPGGPSGRLLKPPAE